MIMMIIMIMNILHRPLHPAVVVVLGVAGLRRDVRGNLPMPSDGKK